MLRSKFSSHNPHVSTCDHSGDTRTYQEENLQKELAVPRFAGKKKEWPTAKAKERKRKSLRSKLAREAQQKIDKYSMKGVV